MDNFSSEQRQSSASGLYAYILLCCWPGVSFTNHNRTIMEWSDGAVALFIFGVLCAVGLAAIQIFRLLFLRRRPRALRALYVFAGLCVLLSFSYDFIAQIRTSVHSSFSDKSYYQLMQVFVAATVFASMLALAALCYAYGIIIRILTVFLLTLTALPALSFVAHQMNKNSSDQQQLISDAVNIQETPNIYYVVVDGYARNDQLALHAKLDNQKFINWLRSNGLEVSNSSYANYPNTYSSLAAALGQKYLYQDGDVVPNRNAAVRVVGGNNKFVSDMRARGYTYIHVPSSLALTSRCQGDEDICIKPDILTANEVVNGILQLNVVGKYMRRYMFTARSIPSLKSVWDKIEKLKLTTPYFVFVHSLPPHPPYIYTPECEFKVSASTRLVDTSTPGLLTEEKRVGYSDNVRCANKQIRYFLSQVAEKDPDAIVVLHSDHGSDLTVDWNKSFEEFSAEQIQERFAILMSMRLPKRCKSIFYDGISPVNTLEVVSACLERREAKFQADESYFIPYEQTGVETIVTKIALDRDPLP